MQRQEWLKPRMDQLFQFKARVEASGRDFNSTIQGGREYRNPRICEKLIETCRIDQYGTNFPVWGVKNKYCVRSLFNPDTTK